MDLLQAGLCVQVSNVQVGNTATTNLALFSLTNTFPLGVGMWVSGNNLSGNVAFIQKVVNSTAVELSQQPTAASNGTYTFRGDTLNMALIKFGPTGGYDRNTQSYSNIVTTSDEVTGTGYTAKGFTLTPVAPGAGALAVDITDSNTAIINFSPNPNWTTATLDVAGCMIFNYGAGNVAGQARVGWIGSGASCNGSTVGLTTIGANSGMHAISLHDFGGEQKVTAGTLTVNMPTANGTAAIIRLG